MNFLKSYRAYTTPVERTYGWDEDTGIINTFIHEYYLPAAIPILYVVLAVAGVYGTYTHFFKKGNN